MGVVRGELGIDRVGCGQKFPGASEIGDIGVHPAGEHREPFQPVDLRPLDFAIPVSAFY